MPIGSAPNWATIGKGRDTNRVRTEVRDHRKEKERN